MLSSRTVDLTRRFYEWELRGRGWASYPYPVALEPPFRPFTSHEALIPAPDDGRHPTKLSLFFERLQGVGADREFPEEIPEPEPEAAPAFSECDPAEFLLALPPGTRVARQALLGFLRALACVGQRIAFELVGGGGRVEIRLALAKEDAPHALGQLRAALPALLAVRAPEPLKERWRRGGGALAALEFGLGSEFMVPLARPVAEEPLLALVAALAGLGQEETGFVQVLFEETRAPWASSILRSVVTHAGAPFFADAPEVTARAKEKVASPLFAVALRVAGRAPESHGAWEIVRRLAGGLAQFGSPVTNEFMPLASTDLGILARDLLDRTTHRPGMLLSTEELLPLVQLPGAAVEVPELWRGGPKSKRAPAGVQGAGCLLGQNDHAGESSEVRLPAEVKTKHVHVVGASGSGKSTLLTRMIFEDLARGEGLAVLDPHGDLVDEILSRFPEERESDLILFDPGDEEVSLGWNMLAGRSETEKTLLSSDLVGVFRRLSTSWGDQMNSVLANAILAFLESETGGTLLDLRRFLVDREFRAEFLRTVHDPEVLYYWQREFPLLKGLPQGPILTRLDTFLRPKLVRRVVVEREHRLDFRAIVDQGKVFLAKLAQGAIGEENAALLGSLIVSAFHQAAMSRQDLAPGARRHFFLYLDEFHEVATPSMASLLTGARKYRLGLILAHQELRQLEARNRDLASAVLANPAVRIVFRVGEGDARDLERGFSFFAAADLLSLGVGEAIARVERADHDFNLKTDPLPDLAPEDREARRAELIALTRATFPRHPEEAREEAAAPPPASVPEPAREVPRAEALPQPAVPPPPPPKRATREETPVPPLGRGGPEHQYLQDLVKRWAESNGYRAVIEEEILDGRGSVDVSLRTDEFSIACEISVTSTVEQEVGNVLKCFEAGFHEIAVLGLKRPHLARIEAGLKKKLAAPELARVHFLSPEELFTMLSLRPKARETVVGGYKVKVRHEAVDADEAAARYKALTEVVAKSVRRMKGGEKP